MDLAVLKALGDETRYAMYRELATATSPLSAQDLADRLGLHANTVRLHLDRLREVGLVDVEAVHRGTVGRPQHRYFLAAGAPGLGFEPAVEPGDGTAEGAARIEFLHCPFRELAEAYPELVCNLHRGLCEGVVDQVGGGSVEEFATLYDHEPCHVTVAVGYPDRQ